MLMFIFFSTILFINALLSDGFLLQGPKLPTVKSLSSKIYMVECQPGQFDSLVVKSKTPVVVDFYANWCGPCKLMGPIFEQLSNEYPENVLQFVKVDTDTNEDAIDQYNIQGLPLFGVFVNGEMIGSHSGALGKEVLREFILGCLKSHSIRI